MRSGAVPHTSEVVTHQTPGVHPLTPERLIGDKGLRQRWVGQKADGELRHRNDRAQPSPTQSDSGWPAAAAVCAPLEGRTHVRLAFQFSALDCSLRISHRKLQGIPTLGRWSSSSGIYEMASSGFLGFNH